VNRKIIALNLALLALLGTLGWMLRAHWRETRAQELATLAKAAAAKAQLPPPALQPPEAVVPATYLEVAQKTLFSKDRNPNVIIETVPPPAPKPEEPTPPRPVYHGQMGMGDPVAFLSLERGSQKGFHAGEKVGPFKLVAFDRETITFEWKEKTLKYPLEELKPKADSPAQAAAAAAVPAQAVSAGPIIGISTSKEPVLGPANGGVRGCITGDNSPAGTVKDGFKKTITPGMFGQMCQWEPIQ